jgi:hypothetical protein
LIRDAQEEASNTDLQNATVQDFVKIAALAMMPEEPCHDELIKEEQRRELEDKPLMSIEEVITQADSYFRQLQDSRNAPKRGREVVNRVDNLPAHEEGMSPHCGEPGHLRYYCPVNIDPCTICNTSSYNTKAHKG